MPKKKEAQLTGDTHLSLHGHQLTILLYLLERLQH